MSNLNQAKFSKANDVIVFPRPCTLCESKNQVTQQLGIWVCATCLGNIQQTNPNLFHVDNKSLPINF
ncbi:hypothetical protein AABF64_002080 [Acinetobacter baumannii]|nr:hypothetical protein [Acinetobacter baumannii]WEH90844.1 hypothetical protein PX669_19400 [Acinetobacter soli]